MTDSEEQALLPFSAIRSSGLLWAINKTLMHPRGYALGLDDDEGWTVYGDGTEPWSFGEGVPEDDLFNAFEALLASAGEPPSSIIASTKD